MVEINDRYHSALPWFFVALFIVFGPIISILQIIRRLRIWVRVEPNSGLVLRNGRRIVWKDIAHIEHYPGIFSYSDRIQAPTSGTAVVAAIKLSCLAVPALLVWYVFLPVFSVLSPWHARVTIFHANGEKIILRDLKGSRDFCRMVEYKIEGH